MELVYPQKRDRNVILQDYKEARLRFIDGVDGAANFLIHGDNCAAMSALVHTRGWRGKVDLIYIDPPYATNTVFRHHTKRTATVSAATNADVAYADTRQGAEFLEFLRERIIFLHELLAPHGSMFLHIDYKIGHYVKIILDEIFGAQNFRNDITRVKCNPKNFARKGFGNVKDMVLFYSKSSEFVWHEPKVHLTDEDVARLFSKVDASGRRYTTTPLHAPGETVNGNTGKEWRGMKPPIGRHWRYDPKVLDALDAQGLIEWSSSGNPRKIIYADDAELKGKKLQDIWEFKDPQYPEYPTEKNLEMLRTIVEACSDPGHTILDCFCGSGTTMIAAQETGRHWIGIDESPVAIRITRKRLGKFDSLFGGGYAVYAVDTTGARRMSERAKRSSQRINTA